MRSQLFAVVSLARIAAALIAPLTPAAVLADSWTWAGTNSALVPGTCHLSSHPAVVAQEDFGAPSSVTGYRVCVYDHSAGAPRLAIAAAIAAAESCGSQPCRRALSDRAWSYVNPVASAGGIAKILLKGGSAGQPSVRVPGKGGGLSLGASVSGTATSSRSIKPL